MIYDFWHAGDLNDRTLDVIFGAIIRINKTRNYYLFDKLLYNFEFWKKMGVPKDRMKFRCIYIREGYSKLSKRRALGPISLPIYSMETTCMYPI